MAEPRTHQLADDSGETLEGCVLYVADSPQVDDIGRSFRLTGGHAVIGQSPGCELRLSDPSVSGFHARVSLSKAGIGVRDLDSTNGTRLGGHKITEVQLTAGARLVLGETAIDIIPLDRFDDDDDEPLTRYGDLVGTSPSMQRLFTQLKRVESSQAPVLLYGETGTGKELIANAIHAHSARADQSYVITDCTAVPANLIESELFGHVRGAFTGADRDRAGAFVEADGGTIFLDEIGELPLELQPKLLRVLETGQVKPVGASKHRRVDVRFIAATNRELSREVDEGRFRADLFYRIVVLRIDSPPLRAHKEDIPVLCATLASQLGIAESAIPPAAREFFARYDWPGNVRELRNAVERVTTLGEHALPELPEWEREHEIDGTFSEARKKAIARFEEAYLRDVWERTGNVAAAAREAGIDRKYMRQLLKRHGLYEGQGGGNV